MYLSRRMQSGSYAVYRQGLAEVLHTYNKVERKTSMNPYPKIILFGRDYSNQMSPQNLNLSNPVNAGKYFSNDFNNSKMQSSPPNPWFNLPSWGRWFIGSVISVVLYFWNNNRMQQLKRIKGSKNLLLLGDVPPPGPPWRKTTGCKQREAKKKKVRDFGLFLYTESGIKRRYVAIWVS
ncbi:hypothetical protein IGI04_012591 [Brassica rapa subsp. trilocularis]|uniref:Uncharacterized protein n=1 Tax=Brassica rapa subsp. trilocularis TaxID=1813537 RepID=A0ABQ7N6D2_BRACM|nr:hypothetical protein IGI04_012591 [Brassica rapa subsp. trilocularis]